MVLFCNNIFLEETVGDQHSIISAISVNLETRHIFRPLQKIYDQDRYWLNLDLRIMYDAMRSVAESSMAVVNTKSDYN